MQLVLGCGDNGVLHVQKAVVGIDRVAYAPCRLHLDAAILHTPRILVEHAAARGVGQRLYKVLAVYIEDVDPIGYPAAREQLREGYLVVPHRFGRQIGVGRTEHIHLAYDRIAESLRDRSLQLDGMRQMKRQPRLRHPLLTHARVAVQTNARIDRKPARYMLAQVDISGQLVLVFVDNIAARTGLLARDILRPRPAAVTEPVEAQRKAAALEQTHALVYRHARHIVARVEAPLLRRLSRARRIAVVDPVSAPVVKQTQRARGAFVLVREGQRRHAARNALVAVDERRPHGARAGGVEVRYVGIGARSPVPGDLVAQLCITAVLLEAHVVAMTVRAVVRTADHRRESPGTHAVRELGFERVVGAVTGMQIGVHAVGMHLARDDIHNASHGVGAVKHRGGAPQHLDPIGQHRLVGVGYRVAEDTRILRMTVDKHHHAGAAAAQTAQRYASGSTARDTVTHYAARRSEQSGHLLGQHGQQRGLHRPLDRSAPHDRDGHGQMPYVGAVARTGHYDLPDLVYTPQGQCVGRLRGRCRQR